LNERGRVLERARTYNLFENTAAGFHDVYQRFFAGIPRGVSGKSVSSRHFEPMGTKTCQILLEGDYNGVLKPNEHYIPVRRDLSDVEEAFRKFRDDAYRNDIAERAYDYAMSEHTYAHRVAALVRSVSGATEPALSRVEQCVESRVS
jgi:spore maturation protein CgeB